MGIVAFLLGGCVGYWIMAYRMKAVVKKEKMLSFMAGYQRGQEDAQFYREEWLGD